MGRLVRLELENFKSYKGHQTIGPFMNFTSVIGPNGAGKSNLMDAISFVLGVKSAQLRSLQLRDLIYRGRAMQDDDEDLESTAIEGRTNNPKRAWVMAVYQDDSGNEIKFTRAVTSSGTSEYKINNKVVTYAKYNETLEKQNILVKARNFLVFQGDVEAIASQSPKDLTRLIEQISGSLELKAEYEQLKIQQERATENSAFNFNKKRGINAEIKQYTEQKQEAERFERLLTEKAEIQVKYLVWRLYHIQEQIDKCRKQIERHNEHSRDKQEEQEQLNEELRIARQQRSEVDKQRNNLERKIRGKEGEIEDKRPTFLTLEEKISHLSKKLNHYEQNADRIQKDHDKQIRNVERLKKELDTVNRAAARYEEEVSGSGKRNTSLTTSELAEYNKKKEEVNKRTVTEKQELENLNRKEKTDSESTQRLKERFDDLERRLQQLIEDKDELSGHEEKVRTYVSQLLADVDSKQKELDVAVAERTRISRQEVKLNEQLQDVLNKLMDARVDQRELEREQKMKELLESLKRVFEGVHGRVIDMCKTTQRKYDVAISIILGRNMEAIIVDTEKIGLECIQYIREQRLGHATFIPLDTIAAKPINDKYRSTYKGARLAIDVIDYPRELERALQYASGNTLVCDTLDIAKAICFGKNEEVKAVTLDGTIIHKSGLITGGKSGIEVGARKFQESDFEAMSRKRDSLMSQLNELSKSKRKANVEEQIKVEISGLQSKLALFRDDLNATKRKLVSTNDELNVVQGEMNQLQPKCQQAQSDLSTLKSRIARLEEVINRTEDAIFKDFCIKIRVTNIREYEQRQFKMAQETAEMRLRFATQQSRLQNQLKFGEEQLKETADRLTKLQGSIKESTNFLSTHEGERNRILQDNERISEEINGLRRELEQINVEFSEKSEIFNNLRKDLAQANKELDKISKEVAKREDDIRRCHSDQFSIFRKCKLEEIELPLLEGSLDDIPIEDSRVQDEMDIDDDEPGSSNRVAGRAGRLDSGWPVVVDYSGLSRQEQNGDLSDMEKNFLNALSEKAAEIERMAPNLKAIERLDVVEQRLHDTEKEFDSARREAKSAKEKFNIIKQKRYKRFHDAYSHIVERIDQIYKDLTKSRNFPLGGTAYLSLEDTEEPYLNGVKYHAMPPMKRFRDMEQLSGGEKTMAALALLFAIHSYQPSPFFVLDEVDAALDNTNVGKIANYIREHASDTFQFVVISLKSTLYEKAQALVGIYRDQEMNSSKTLALQLDKFEE